MSFEGGFQLYFVVFVRVAALFLSMPFLSAAGIPGMARGGLAFFVALAMMPLLQSYPGIPSPTASDFLFILLCEALLGILMGLMLQLIFAIFQTAGEIFSMQMAFSASQVFDPVGEIEQPLLGQFLDTIATLLFLTTGPLQKFLLEVLAQSFQTLPQAIKLLSDQEHLIEVLIYSTSFLLEQALLIALPVVGSILMVSVALGLMAKAAPQMNLLVLGFPLQITMGMMVIFLGMPYFLEYMLWLFDNGIDRISSEIARQTTSSAPLFGPGN